MNAIVLGDWVQTEVRPGIWQVFRIETGFFEDRWDLSAPKVRSSRTLVFMRRIVGRSGKRSFATKVCEASLVRPVRDEQLRWLEQLLREDPALAAAFEAYKPEPVDLVANIGFGLPDEFGAERFAAVCERLLRPPLDKHGLTIDEMLALLAESELESYRDKTPRAGTLQLISPDHLRRGDDFVITDFQKMDF